MRGRPSLLYFRNDRGQTLVERGVETIKVGKAGSIALRFAAMAAMCAVIYMVTYNVPVLDHQQRQRGLACGCARFWRAGLAHDFNNLLTVILLNLELALGG